MQKRQKQNRVTQERVFNHQDFLDDIRGHTWAWPHALRHTDDWEENPFQDANGPSLAWPDDCEAALGRRFFVGHSQATAFFARWLDRPLPFCSINHKIFVRQKLCAWLSYSTAPQALASRSGARSASLSSFTLSCISSTLTEAVPRL